jgi:DNA (cytosine-5)-methyltransferase 1
VPRHEYHTDRITVLLSLFCGAGGLDLGFEQAGYTVGLAYDRRTDSVLSYNHNRSKPSHASVMDVTEVTLESLDEDFGSPFHPTGVIGGPPCQSFSRANTVHHEEDPRHDLPLVFARLLGKLNARSPVKFFVIENVTGLQSTRHAERLASFTAALGEAGFSLSQTVLTATDCGVPQKRQRLFIVGLNTKLFAGKTWSPPSLTRPNPSDISVRSAISGLPAPAYFHRDLDRKTIPFHPNHWCMQPKSDKFTTPGRLTPGNGRNRSFKTLHWDKPSLTVAYGNREVHIHPDCHRRLSVYEAMQLQGFPQNYELLGSLSSQIIQISEAVPPPMAEVVATSVRSLVLELELLDA